MNTRTFALIFGLVFIVVGIGGFILNQPATPDPSLTMRHGFGHELGLFPVNTIHNLIHIVFGLWGLAASRGLAGAITYARAVAVIYALLTVLGLIAATRTTFGFVPIYGNDVWLHAGLALIAAYFGWAHRNAAVTDRL
jgi:hypothetical protein